MIKNGIKRRPQANAEAERFMKPIIKIIHTARIYRKEGLGKRSLQVSFRLSFHFPRNN